MNVVDPNVTLQLINTMGAWGKVVDKGLGDMMKQVGGGLQLLVLLSTEDFSQVQMII